MLRPSRFSEIVQFLPVYALLLILGCSGDTPVAPQSSTRIHSPLVETVPGDRGDSKVLSWQCESDDLPSILFEVRVWNGGQLLRCDSVLGATSIQIPDPEGLEEPQHNWEVAAFQHGRLIGRSPIWRFYVGRFFHYPLSLDHSWRYKVRFYYTDFRSDVGFPAPLDTIEYSAEVYTLRIDTFPENHKPAFKLAEIIHYPFGEQSADTSFGWFNNERDGLYNYAYEVGSFGLALPRKLAAQPNWQIDPEYARFFTGSTLLPPVSAASPGQYIFDPVKSLVYPLKRGAKWQLVRLGDQITISKEVVGRSFVQTENDYYFCWTIRWNYGDGVTDPWDDISIIDQIGMPGLVSRRTTVQNVRLTSYDYPKGYATATVHQDIELDYMFRTDSINFISGGIDIIDD